MAAGPPGLPAAGRLLCALLLALHAPRAHSQDAPAAPARAPTPPALPQVVVSDDNTRITQSCRLILPTRPLTDADGNGIIQVEGDGIAVDLGGQVLRGAAAAAPQDALEGVGISVRGRGNRVFGGAIMGFRVGIDARDCPGLVLEQLDFAHLRAQRLHSTTEREDLRDWLVPHENDGGEWAARYGAAVSVRDATGVTLRRIRVRGSQNGILLSRVSDSTVCDNDASFLSGWGIALWRSSGNVLCRNSVDFCVRGFSSGVYARGQDSAGILLFEQCCRNTLALNSATHCGDGIFVFAGREALGEAPSTPPHDAAWFRSRGCNDNLIAANDCSDAAAHGIEVTFSFGNRIVANRIDRPSICGIWGGYTQGTQVIDNLIRDGCDDGPADERGAISMEHASGAVLCRNTVQRTPVGVRLWDDADEHLARLPWVAVNGRKAGSTLLVGNSFTDTPIAIEVRNASPTTVAGNTFTGVATPIAGDARSTSAVTERWPAPACPTVPSAQDLGATMPGSARAVTTDDIAPRTVRPEVEGRSSILIGEFGPHDFVTPMLILEPSPPHEHRWRLLGPATIRSLQLTDAQGDLRADITDDRRGAVVHNPTEGQSSSYRLAVCWGTPPAQVAHCAGALLGVPWHVRVAALPPAPEGTLPAPAAVRAAAESGQVVQRDSLSFRAGTGTLRDGRFIDGAAGELRDDFGILASGTTRLGAGDWLLRVRSDDGVQVRVDGAVVIDRWNIHQATDDTATIHIDAPRDIALEVLYCERSGAAELDVRLERIAGKQPPAPPAGAP